MFDNQSQGKSEKKPDFEKLRVIPCDMEDKVLVPGDWIIPIPDDVVYEEQEAYGFFGRTIKSVDITIDYPVLLLDNGTTMRTIYDAKFGRVVFLKREKYRRFQFASETEIRAVWASTPQTRINFDPRAIAEEMGASQDRTKLDYFTRLRVPEKRS